MSRFFKGLKEGFSIFLIIGFCIAAAFPTTGLSQWSGQITQTVVASAIPSNTNPNPGDQITVAINMDMSGMPPPNENLGSFTATLDWDPTVLSFVSHGGILQGFVGVVNTLQAGNGHLTFNGANPLGATGVFDVLVITFDAVGPLGTSTALDLEFSAMAAAFTFQDLLPFLTINDGFVTVGPSVVNSPPVLTSIANQTMDENTTLDVPVSATDPDVGDMIALTVNNLPAFGSFTDNGDGTGTISFAPGFDDAGTYSMIEVIATDDGTPPMADTVYFDLTVNNVNRAPILAPIANQTVDENATLDVPVSATDPDLDNITLSVNNLPTFANFTDNGDGTGTISFAPLIGDAGTYPNIEVIAADNGTPSLSDTTSFGLTVNPAPTFEVVSSAIPSNSTPNSGDQITVAINFDLTGMSGSPDSLLGSFTGTINWDPSVLSFVSHSGILQGYVGVVNTTQAGNGMITFNGANPLGLFGVFDVLVITFDVTGTGGTSTALDLEYSAMAAAFTFNDLLPYLTVNDGMVTVMGGGNPPPALTPIPNQTMDENTTLDVPVSATDPNMNSITLSVNNLPAFGSFTDNGDGTGTISFAPGYDDAGTYSMIEVIATDDGTPPAADTVYFDLTVNNVNRAPTLASIANQTVNENNTLDVPVSATDPDMDNLTLSTNNLPSFGSFTDNGDGTGTISFAPLTGDAGTYPNIEVVAADNGTPSLSDTVSFTLVVNAVGQPQVVSSAIPSNSTPSSGDQITVAINFDMTGMAGFPDSLLGSFTGTINWDPTVLSYASNGGIIGFTGVVNTNQAGSGMITFNGANPFGQSGIFDVLILTFDVTGAGGTSTVLDLEYQAMAAALTFNNLLPYLIVNDGMVTVSGIIVDMDPPSCALTNVIPGPPKAIEVTVQDTGSGLGQVNVVSATNANVSIPPFTPGTTTPVVVVATKINQNAGSSVTLQVIDMAGNTTVCDPVYTTIAATIPDQYELMQNFPNPFNPSTTIHFNITEDLEGISNVSLKIFDLTGREIKTLVNEPMQPGQYSVDWDGTNNHGAQVAGGVYLYRLVAGDFTSTKKMILMK